MSGGVKCLVCGIQEEYGRKHRFYRFPRDTERCRAWVKAIGIKDLIYMPIEELHLQFVCEIHFPPQCFSRNSMHKVALPIIKTHFPPLPDELMTKWPTKKRILETAPLIRNVRVIRQQRNITNEQRNTATTNPMDTDTRIDAYPIIDYERPLMTCVETLEHNEKICVKKPAGILNTISVPLMTYSSSLEHGTVFAAADPFDVPLEPNIVTVNHGLIASKNLMYTNVMNSKASIDPILSNLDATIRPNSTEHQYTATNTSINTKSIHHKKHDVTFRPNTVTTVQQYKTIKKYMNAQATHDTYTNSDDVSLKATMHPRKVIKKYSNSKAHSKHKDASGIPNTKTMEHNYKETIKYTNTKDSTSTNTNLNSVSRMPTSPTTESSEKGYKKDSNRWSNSVVSFGLKTIIMARGHKATGCSPDTITQGLKATTQPESPCTMPLAPSTGYTNSDISLIMARGHKATRCSPDTITQGFKATTQPDSSCTMPLAPSTGYTNTSDISLIMAHGHKATRCSPENTQGFKATTQPDSSCTMPLAPSTGYTNTSDISLIMARGHKATRCSPENTQGFKATTQPDSSCTMPLAPSTGYTNTSDISLIMARGLKATRCSPENTQGFKATTQPDSSCTMPLAPSTGYTNTSDISLITARGHKSTRCSPDINTQGFKSTTQPCTMPLALSTGYTNTSDISFMPYTEHVPTVTPESTDAHVGGGFLVDYGLPLMNCIGTVLQGKIHSTTKSEETAHCEATIDIPLMRCLKTLEDTEII